MLFTYFLTMRGLYIMDKYIVILMNMFTLQNEIFIAIPDENKMEEIGSCSIEELPNFIVNLAYDKKIYNVKIAEGKKYSQLVEYGIETAEINKYNERKIEIEVI